MTCSQEAGVYSWEGMAALGSCLTTVRQTWLENVLTHAAGAFILNLLVSVVVVTKATLVAGQSAIVSGRADSAFVVWQQDRPVPSFELQPRSACSVSRISFVTSTTAPVAQVGPESTFRASDCEFTQLGGSGIVLSGSGSVSVVNSVFGGLCSQCYAIDATDPASLVTMQRMSIADRALSEAVSFPICVHSADMVLSDANHCAEGSVAVSLAKDTEPLGLLTVPSGQTLELRATSIVIVDARFDVHGSLTATGLAFRHESSSSQLPLFSGDGALQIESCQAIDSSGSTTPLQVACAALSLGHGHTGGQCGGALGDSCGFLSCDQGYTLSSSAVTRRCQAGGIWNGPIPTG